MNFLYIKVILLPLLTFLLNVGNGQNQNKGFISGNLFLDDSWSSEIYLSYIPTYDDMYLISDDMIVAKTDIDSLGYFEFDTNILPSQKKLYRLHIIKKGDSSASLIIGGRNENHLFLIADCYSKIIVSSYFSYPPFKDITFNNSLENSSFQQVRSLIFKADSSSSESSAAKRIMIEEKLEKDLLAVADSSQFFLVSLYAIYESKFETNYISDFTFYNRYFEKWENEDNAYYKSLKKQLPIKRDNNFVLLFIIALILSVSAVIFIYWKRPFNQKKKLNKLSLQERRIFEMLREGLTNQEISDQCLIGISTTKSHVSSIYSKLNIKSRKEIMNLEL